MLELFIQLWYNLVESTFFDAQIDVERGGCFMKKEYETPLVVLLRIQEDTVRCSEGAQEDIFGDKDWN